MAAHASQEIHCENVSTQPNLQCEGYSDFGVQNTEPSVTDVGVVLKVIDPVLLCERKQPANDDHLGLESDEYICEAVHPKTGVIQDCELDDTQPNVHSGEMEMHLIVPELLPQRMQELVGKMLSGLECDENSDENVDSKVDVFCDTLPNVCDGEMEPQLIVPDFLPGRTQEVVDRIHSGLDSDEDVDSKTGVISELGLDDIKPRDVGMESLRIDPDALRGRMQQMVDKIHSGLAVLCSNPVTATACFQSPESTTRTRTRSSTRHPLQVSSERAKKALHLGKKKIRFHCPKCSEVFKDQSCYEDHQKSHRRKELYLCPYCRRVFNYGFKLRDHMAVHVGEETACHHCPYCERIFKTSVKLRDHVTSHTGEKPFQCGLCGASFMRKSSFQNHKRIHTGKRKFICVKCGKRFKFPSHLSKHKRSCRS